MGIAAVDMSEKNNKSNTPADNTKPEKKMTKYDLKMQRRQEEEKKAKKEKTIIKTGCILAVIICVCIAAWKFYDNYQEKHGPYITVGDHEIQKAEFDYYYYSSLNSFASTYGSYLSYFGLDTSKPLDQQQYSDTMTWDDYFQQQAVNQLKNVYALTDEANEKGFEYDATSDYDDMVSSIQSYAQQQGVSEDEYCKSVFGSDATLEGIKPYVEMSGLASAYYNDVKDNIEVTDDEINTYYDENKDNYDSVDYRVCKIEADMPEEETEAETEAQTETVAESSSETAVTESQTETESETMSAEESEAAAKAEEEAKAVAMAEAKAKADDMLSKITDEASFEKVYGDYATDASTDSLNTGKKKSSISPTDVANWLFDADRQAGDTTVIEDTANNAYYVVYFKDRYLDHTKTVDVRHILISADTASTDTAETEETETAAAGETETAETESAEAQEQAKEDAKAAAKIKAEQILDDWKNGDATEDSFAELAKTYSDDSGSNTNGGLYEAVKQGQMVTNFNDWIFDASRKPGDTGIVESDYGYHIIYFVGDNKEEWYVNIKDTITSNKLNDYMADLTADVEVKDSRHHVAYLHETEAATETASDTAASTESAAASESAAETAASETAVSETETTETAAK